MDAYAVFVRCMEKGYAECPLAGEFLDIIMMSVDLETSEDLRRCAEEYQALQKCWDAWLYDWKRESAELKAQLSWERNNMGEI